MRQRTELMQLLSGDIAAVYVGEGRGLARDSTVLEEIYQTAKTNGVRTSAQMMCFHVHRLGPSTSICT